jgi:hypothetical protein
MLSAIMVAINIAQAALLERLHGHTWITTFPLVVFVLALCPIAVLVFPSRKRLWLEWKEAEGGTSPHETLRAPTDMCHSL